MCHTRAFRPAPVFSHCSPLASFGALHKTRPLCQSVLQPRPPALLTLHQEVVTCQSDKRQSPTQAFGGAPHSPRPCLPTPSLGRASVPWYLLPSALLRERGSNTTPPFPVLPRGVEPYDKPNTVYIERHEPSGTSTVIRSTDFFQSQENKEIILEDVEDFQLRDKYMFATKSVVSITRSPPLRLTADALVQYRFCRLGRSRSGCKVLGLGKSRGCLGRPARRGLVGWGWQGKGRCGSAARWLGGRLSERITVKRGLGPRSLTCSGLERKLDFQFAFLRKEDVGEQRCSVGPSAARASLCLLQL